jgi:hypothetical protein
MSGSVQRVCSLRESQGDALRPERVGRGREDQLNFNNFSIHIGSGLFASQVFDFFGGFFLLLIGAAILYTIASWRFRGLQVDGEIIGVRRRGPYFHGVYRYIQPSGEPRQATSVQGSNNPQRLQAGRHVPIQVMPDKPDEAREQHAPMLWTLTIALLLSGAGLIYVGATVSKHSLIAWVVIVLAVAWAAYWLWKRTKALVANLKPLAVPDPWSALPIEPAETLGAAPRFTPQLKSSGSKSRRAGMIFIVLGASVFALDIWQARGLLALRHGVRTSGVVMELSEGAADRSSDTFLFPVVQYTGEDGSVVRFHDRTGARPSPYKLGDTVPVRYLPGKPTTAAIDRGPSNWEPFGALAVMGIMLTGLGSVALRSQITGE